MLKIVQFGELKPETLAALLKRNTDPTQQIQQVVEGIILAVAKDGDKALKHYSMQFDGIALDKLSIGKTEIHALADSIGRQEKRALEIAFNNIHKFHQTQASREKRVETSTGVTCWREARPIEKVGLYIPGGSAVLPSTFLMLGVPAKIAGCKEIVVCTPPQPDGKINGYVAYCAQLLQIDTIYLVGGAQAIAAMAYGTESIPKVDKLFGPGNQYVTQAKTLVQTMANIAIDMPAGPSEVLIIADESANPAFVAADLLAQAEHGKDSQAIVVSTSPALLEKVNQELEQQLTTLPRAQIAKAALNNSYAVLCNNIEEALSFSNQYAPEHLILAIEDAENHTRGIINAGSVFLGPFSPETFGDYASGTNHTLPTSGFAKSHSGASVDSFVKKITFQHIDENGLLNLGPTVEVLAQLEGLQAHRHAVSIRIAALKNKPD